MCQINNNYLIIEEKFYKTQLQHSNLKQSNIDQKHLTVLNITFEKIKKVRSRLLDLYRIEDQVKQVDKSTEYMINHLNDKLEIDLKIYNLTLSSALNPIERHENTIMS
ncbi:MAG: hypothetical protein JHC93_03665 [Parachlamydiales bacterium]|nr:hypothetical protein [Parachlamydiales bacterium]